MQIQVFVELRYRNERNLFANMLFEVGHNGLNVTPLPLLGKVCVDD
jgi:hypothetical protein